LAKFVLVLVEKVTKVFADGHTTSKKFGLCT